MWRPRVMFSLVLLLGLGVRVALGFLQPADLTADNDGYLAHARPIAEGHGFLGPYSGKPTAFRPPAYPYALGFLLACGVTEPLAVVCINGLATTVILWLTRTLALQAGVSAEAAFAAMATAALDPLLVRYSIMPMTEVPCTAVLLAAVVAFRWRRENGSVSPLAAMCSGICFGVGALVRPVLLISCGMVTAAAFIRSLRHRLPASSPEERERSVSGTSATDARRFTVTRTSWLLPCSAALLILAPWILRNAVYFHKFIPATTHGGYTLALGNNPDFYRDVINGDDQFPWDGPSLATWQNRMIDEILHEVGPLGTEPQNDAWYYQQAISAIQADVPSFLKAIVLRMRRFWAVTTAENQSSGRVAMLVGIWYVWLWLGLILERISAWRLKDSYHRELRQDLWLIVLSFMLMHTVYWTDTRMRTPLMPLLIVLSTAGWSTIVYRRIFPHTRQTAPPASHSVSESSRL